MDSQTIYNKKLTRLKGGLMSTVARALRGSLVGLTTIGRACLAQQTGSYQLNGQEMVFILLLVAFVIGGWVGYEWVRKGRTV